MVSLDVYAVPCTAVTNSCPTKIKYSTEWNWEALQTVDHTLLYALAIVTPFFKATQEILE